MGFSFPLASCLSWKNGTKLHTYLSSSYSTLSLAGLHPTAELWDPEDRPRENVPSKETPHRRVARSCGTKGALIRADSPQAVKGTAIAKALGQEQA